MDLIVMLQKYNIRVNESGDKYHYLNGELHREDGPAVECANGHKEWWLNGKLHRENGPAIEWHEGHKSWYVDGKRHREDGPAIEDLDGYKSWWLKGKLYGFNNDFTNISWKKFIKTLIFA